LKGWIDTKGLLTGFVSDAIEFLISQCMDIEYTLQSLKSHYTPKFRGMYWQHYLLALTPINSGLLFFG